MKRSNRSSLLAFLFGSCVVAAFAQAPATTTLSGCAMPLAGHPDFLTLCEPSNCSLLRGAVNLKWAGHAVKLRGVLHPPTSNQPRTLDVTEAVTVADACTAVCKPSIPGRGVGPKDRPDGEGATPGIDKRDQP